jgi:uncharacterized membrane protein YqjE
MLARLVALITTHPDLLIEHAESYVDLLQEEAREYRQQLRRTLIVAGALSLAVFSGIFLTAIAAMLWAVNQNQMWILLAVPATFLIIALVAYLRLSSSAKAKSFTSFRTQVLADASALKQAMRTS